MMKTSRARMPALKFSVVFAVGLCVSYCSKAPLLPASPTSRVESPERYSRSEKQGLLGKLELFSITEKALSEEKAKALAGGYVEISLPSHLSLRAFKERSAASRVFVVPKILLRTQSTPSSSIHGALALVDGLTSQLGASISSQAIPKDFVLSQKGELLEFLKKDLGKEPTFLSSVPLPKNAAIHGKDTPYLMHFRGTYRALALNSFSPVSLELNDDERVRLTKTLREPNGAKVALEIPLQSSITLEYGTLRLNNRELQSRVHEAIAKDERPLSPSALNNALAQLETYVSSDFGLSEALINASDFRRQVTDQFFGTLFNANCPRNTGVCYFPKTRAPEGTLSVSLKREDFYGPIERIRVETPLRDASNDHSEFLVQGAPGDLMSPPTVPSTANLLRSVRPGTCIHFRLNRLSLSKLELSVPKIENIPKRTCIDPYSQCTEGRWKCVNQQIEKINPRQECTGGYREECLERCHIFRRGESDTEISRTCRPTNPTDWHDRNPTRPSTDRDVCTKRGNICQGFTTIYDERRVCDTLTPPRPLDLPHRTYRAAELEKLSSETLQKIGYVRVKNQPILVPSDDCPNAPLVKVNPPKEFSVNRIDPNFEWQCTRETHNHCDKDKWEDRWERVTTFSHPFAGSDLEDLPLSKTNTTNLLSSLSFRFTSLEKGRVRELTCPVSALPTEVHGQYDFTVTFTNTENCTPFTIENSRPNFNPSLAISSRVSFEKDFRCGTLWENYQGKRQYTCRLPDGRSLRKASTREEDERLTKNGERTGIYAPFYPRARVQGTLRLIGETFSTIGE